MFAFHNDPAIKAKYLARVRAHAAADELVKGTGWSTDGKGCAIGCTLEAYDHARYPIELGIPEMLARLEDCIFEGLANDIAQRWPERFLETIEPGADLSRVGWQFLHWLLTESGIGSYDHPLVKDAVAQCAAVIEPLTRGEPADASAAWSAARSAARSAAWSAESAAKSAAKSAAWSAARSAAWSAAESAESAAKSAAWSAAESAESAAKSAAWSAAYLKMANKLLELLANAGVKK